MSLDIGYGSVQKESGWVAFSYADPGDNAVYTYDTFTDCVSSLRKKYGQIEVSIREGYMNQEFAFTIYEKPF